MEPGHLRGEGRSRGDSGDAAPDPAGASGPWPDGSSADTAGADPRSPRPSTRQPHLRPDRGRLRPDDAAVRHLDGPGTQQGADPARYDITDFGGGMFSGPGAELYGVADGDTSGDAAPTAQTPDAPVPRQEDEDPASQLTETGSGLVRPYFRTRGRTRPSYDLALEALVSTSERGRLLDGVRVPEHRSICDLCLDTRSVAEVAALLSLPLGVVRVLVGDVAGLGLVLVHTASSGVDDRPSVEFMERVLSGLRRI